MSCWMLLSTKITSPISRFKYIQPLFSFHLFSFLLTKGACFFYFYSVPLPIVALIPSCPYCLSLFGPCINPSKAPPLNHKQPPLQRSYNLLWKNLTYTHRLPKETKTCIELDRMREREKGMGGRKHVQNSRLASSSPCAGCKLLRRRCAHDCIFAPYFPASEPLKFATVHKVFGASNVSKLLQDIPVQHRGDAVSSLVYEANARVRDPIYGCVGAISSLQHQVESLQAQLALAQAEMVNLRMRQATYLAHQLGQESLQNNTYIGLGKGAAVSTDSSAMSSQKLVECDANLKAMFNLDVVVDQTNLGSPMWSC